MAALCWICRIACWASAASFFAFSSFCLATFSRIIFEIVFSFVDFEPVPEVVAEEDVRKFPGLKL
jgi:hypothetical protein